MNSRRTTAAEIPSPGIESAAVDQAAFSVAARPPHTSEDAAHFVFANDLWHHVLEYGSGRPILIVPGIITCAATLAFVASRLATRARAFVVDVRGRGLSDHPAGGFSLGEYAADLGGVIDRLRLEEPLVVGHSMGARIAAALDVARPGLCGGLVLVDPPLSGPDRPRYPYPLEMYQSMLAAARAHDPMADMRRIEATASDEVLTERIRWLRLIDERAVVETHRHFHDEDFHGLYSGVTAPTLLIRGAESDVVTPDGADELQTLRRDIPVVAIRHAGHLIPQENPDELCAVVTAFAETIPVESATGSGGADVDR